MFDNPGALLGVLIIVAAVAHVFLSKRPIRVGHIQGDLLVRTADGIDRKQCNGFRVECYDSVVVVYVDKSKDPRWTDNCVLMIPWSKVENLTLMPE